MNTTVFTNEKCENAIENIMYDCKDKSTSPVRSFRYRRKRKKHNISLRSESKIVFFSLPEHILLGFLI